MGHLLFVFASSSGGWRCPHSLSSSVSVSVPVPGCPGCLRVSTLADSCALIRTSFPVPFLSFGLNCFPISSGNLFYSILRPSGVLFVLEDFVRLFYGLLPAVELAMCVFSFSFSFVQLFFSQMFKYFRVSSIF